MKHSLCAAVLAIVLSGCATLDQGQDSAQAPLDAQAVQKMGDVPVPAGFRQDYQNSYFFESAGTRVAMLKYQGKANPDAVVNFFKAAMARHNWQLLNVVEYGQRLLNFERENESCIITLAPHGSAVNLIITLGPKTRSILKKAVSPEIPQKPLK